MKPLPTAFTCTSSLFKTVLVKIVNNNSKKKKNLISSELSAYHQFYINTEFNQVYFIEYHWTLMFSLWRQSVPLCKHIAVWAVFCRLPHACLGSIWLRLRRSMLPTLWHEVLLKREFILWMCCCSGFFFFFPLPLTIFYMSLRWLSSWIYLFRCVLWWAHVCRCGAWIVSKACQIKTFFWVFLIICAQCQPLILHREWMSGCNLSCILCAPRWTQSH